MFIIPLCGVEFHVLLNAQYTFCNVRLSRFVIFTGVIVYVLPFSVVFFVWSCTRCCFSVCRIWDSHFTKCVGLCVVFASRSIVPKLEQFHMSRFVIGNAMLVMFCGCMLLIVALSCMCALKMLEFSCVSCRHSNFSSMRSLVTFSIFVVVPGCRVTLPIFVQSNVE